MAVYTLKKSQFYLHAGMLYKGDPHVTSCPAPLSLATNGRTQEVENAGRKSI